MVQPVARTKARERARQRKLSDDELRTVWHASADEGVYGAFIRFILLTATRRGEAARMTRGELTGFEWTIPASRHNKRGTIPDCGPPIPSRLGSPTTWPDAPICGRLAIAKGSLIG